MLNYKLIFYRSCKDGCTWLVSLCSQLWRELCGTQSSLNSNPHYASWLASLYDSQPCSFSLSGSFHNPTFYKDHTSWTKGERKVDLYLFTISKGTLNSFFLMQKQSYIFRNRLCASAHRNWRLFPHRAFMPCQCLNVCEPKQTLLTTSYSNQSPPLRSVVNQIFFFKKPCLSPIFPGKII